VVARQLGKTCLVGCNALQIDLGTRSLRLGSQTLHEGDALTLDGNDGAVYAGQARIALVPDTALQARLHTLRAQGHKKHH
jgi:pyruvate,orthophosphate dikinase